MVPLLRVAATRLCVLVLFADLAGCASLDPADAVPAPLDIPAAWAEADAAGGGAAGRGAAGRGAAGISEASLAQWWQRFDDARLEGLVRTALQANTSVLGATAALRQAQALRDVATASLWPAVGSSASAQRGTAGGRSTGSSFRLGLDAEWAIDVSGARRAGVDAGEAGVAASAAGRGDVQVQVAAEVALNYILLRTVQLRFSIAADNLVSQEETLQITLWRQQAGLVTALGAEQARAAVEQNRARLPELQTSIAQTRHALAVLTGQAPAALTDPLTVRTDRPQDMAVPQARDEPALGIPAQTLRQRADVRAAEYQVAAALARVDQARAQRWPSFAIGGSLGLSAATVGALGGGGAVLGSLLASVTLPVFDGGASRAQVRAQQAALEQARQSYRAAVLAALQQVEDALVALHGDRLRLARLRLAADAAANAAWLARQRYSSGLVDFQTVLETQRTQYAARDGVASATGEVGSGQVRLFRALGGGWPSTTETPNP